MKGTIICHSIAALSALILTGCNLGGEANAVNSPTVDQMADLEKQWGLKPRESHPRTVPPTEQPAYVPDPPANTVPLPVPSPRPPVPEVPPAVTPAPQPETPPIPPSLRE
ncbi:MAG: hypothetical protein WCN98_06935 [Verrucomicrobiaceae bacterium]